MIKVVRVMGKNKLVAEELIEKRKKKQEKKEKTCQRYF